MECARKLFSILLSLCSATMACTKTDPFAAKMGGKTFRTVGPRFGDARWYRCCAAANIEASCERPVHDRGEALALLARSDGECVDAAVDAIERYSPDDLSAAYYIRAQRRGDPVDFLRAVTAAEETIRRNPRSPATLFNRALAQEKLGLTKEAIQSWDDVMNAEESEWADEARRRRDGLMNQPDPADPWQPEDLHAAIAKRDRATVRKFVRTSPVRAQWYFEELDLRDLEGARLLADVIFEGGDPYARDIVEAAGRTADRGALEQGQVHFRQGRSLSLQRQNGAAAEAYATAAALLERAGNPLHLSARWGEAAARAANGEDISRLLDAITPAAKQYPDLTSRVATLVANELAFHGNYVGAVEALQTAAEESSRINDATRMAFALKDRSLALAYLGSHTDALRDILRVLGILPQVADLNTRHQVYGSAARIVRNLGFPEIALHYQTAAVTEIQKAIDRASGSALPTVKQHYAIALRELADIEVELRRDDAASEHLSQAVELAEAADSDESTRRLLRMRLREVAAQSLLDTDPAEAVKLFDDAIALAAKENSTYRAVLFFKRAAARRNAGDARADEDIAAALEILASEATLLLDSRKRGAYENLWNPYFARFEAMYKEMIRSRIDDGDKEGAFLYAEQARAFEPLHLILQSQNVPPGFEKIVTRNGLRQFLATLPADTHILQYLVLDDRTYVWILRRGRIDLLQQRTGRKTIERWVTEANEAVRSGQSDSFTRVMRAAYAELFQDAIARVPAAPQTRMVIVPDGPMHGLPFAALHSRQDGYLIERGSIATAGSTSLYFYALLRDAQFPAADASVLIVGDPAADPRFGLRPLTHARAEAEELLRDYPGARVLLGAEATVPRFLEAAKQSAIVHFAGHGVANPKSPWTSMLLLAPDGKDSGELTAEKLMTELSELERTRLIVLGACSTAGGQPVGVEGVSPLVRPLIAANVPAVVGTLWDVNDATAKDLLVSFHCHYRNGDDVAVALQHAQLEMLRNDKSAMTWAPFQVVGHAASPHALHAALEKPHNEHVCSQNSLHRPDGLHSQ